MPENRPHPLGLLAGPVFIVLLVVGFVISGDTPDDGDSAQSIVSFYHDHHNAQVASAFIIALGAIFGAIFVVHLAGALRSVGRTSAWTALVVIGGGLMVGGLLLLVGTHTAVTTAEHNSYAPDTVRALQSLDDSVWFPGAGGIALFMIGSGAALRHAGLMPNWLATVALGLGILVCTPIGFFALLASFLWILVAGIVLYRALSTGPTVAVTPTPTPAV